MRRVPILAILDKYFKRTIGMDNMVIYNFGDSYIKTYEDRLELFIITKKKSMAVHYDAYYRDIRTFTIDRERIDHKEIYTIEINSFYITFERKWAII